jgi:hypothetical protein
MAAEEGARCLVGLGWLHSRPETSMARPLAGAIVELACDCAGSLLAR